MQVVSCRPGFRTLHVTSRRGLSRRAGPPGSTRRLVPINLMRATRAVEPLDYLVIAPHPDDAELGLGATIALLLSRGARVGVLDLTDGEPTPHGSPEIRRRETEAATAVLGLTWRGNLGLPNRRLVDDLDARAKLAGVLRELK